MQKASIINNLPVSLVGQLSFSGGMSFKRVLFLGFFLVSLLLVFYIFQVNEYTKAGFAIAQYEEKIVEISKENKETELAFSKNYTLAELEEILKTMNYQEVEKISYIKMTGTQMASNIK
jgi:hypothetical protein